MSPPNAIPAVPLPIASVIGPVATRPPGLACGVAVAVLAALPVAGAAWLWQSWLAGLVLGLLAGGGALAMWCVLWRRVRRDYVEPMQVALTLMKDLRSGSTVHRLIEFGAP